MSEQPRPRRSPTGADRKRDPERTRERILDAALVEFGEHGYAGARISAIAQRAGVNQQLISYYFDGKEGLHRALTERWRATSAELNDPQASLADVVAAFAGIATSQRHGTRLLVWDALAGRDEADSKPFHESMVAEMRRRQENGEIAGELDPAYLMLVFFGVALAPTILPRFAENFTGLAADSPEFQAAYLAQLKLLIGRLSG
jgi:AcrR family transcriptional regulator